MYKKKNYAKEGEIISWKYGVANQLAGDCVVEVSASARQRRCDDALGGRVSSLCCILGTDSGTRCLAVEVSLDVCHVTFGYVFTLKWALE